MKGVPLQIGTGGARLFGWFHPPEGAVRRCGVVVCSPIGDEYLRAHRTLRHFAERLQRAGFPVLRFDFHGTGDSPGDERDPDRVRTWISDIGRAADELRAVSGAQQICLAGLRLGATLAMAAAAERGGCDSLVLWSPFSNGKRFVVDSIKQHKMHRMLEPHGFAAEPKGWDPGGDQALGFLLTPATVEALGRVELTAVARPARRALLIGDDGASDGKILEHLQKQGVDAEYRRVPNQKFLLASPHKGSVPEPLLDAMAGWIIERHPDAGAPAPPPPVDRFDEEERPIRFGAQLVGVLSTPPAPPRQTAILMLNAGTTHRVGPHRLYVKMARRWAGLGFRVLRLDLSGIGDSPAPAGSDENLCYPRDALADVQSAMRVFEERFDTRRFLLVGLCSGGDLAFHISLREPRVAGAVLINPLTFCVNDQTLVETYRPADDYATSLFDRQRLKLLLRGQISLKGALANLKANIASVARRWSANRKVSDGLNDVPGLLRRMAGRGVDTLLVAGERDPGVVYVDRHFGAGMRGLATVPGFRRVDLPGTDHTFTSLYAQEQVLDVITRHLEERHR